MKYKILSDQEEKLICINSNLTPQQLRAGFAYGESGLPEVITLKDPTTGEAVCTIQIPPSFQKINTVAAEVEVIFDRQL